MQSRSAKRRIVAKVIVGVGLLGFGASHGITGLLAHLGWYQYIGYDFDAWYMHPAYQSLCWFANGIGLGLLVPLWWAVVWGKRKQDSGVNPEPV